MGKVSLRNINSPGVTELAGGHLGFSTLLALPSGWELPGKLGSLAKTSGADDKHILCQQNQEELHLPCWWNWAFLVGDVQGGTWHYWPFRKFSLVIVWRMERQKPDQEWGSGEDWHTQDTGGMGWWNFITDLLWGWREKDTSAVHPWLLAWVTRGGGVGTCAIPRGREETFFPFGPCLCQEVNSW